jgi:hypothetical protein
VQVHRVHARDGLGEIALDGAHAAPELLCEVPLVRTGKRRLHLPHDPAERSFDVLAGLFISTLPGWPRAA